MLNWSTNLGLYSSGKFLTKSRRVYLSIVIPAWMLESSYRDVFVYAILGFWISANPRYALPAEMTWFFTSEF